MRNPILNSLAAVALMMSGGIASAADVQQPRLYMPAPPRAFYDWSGFYVGGNFGGGWATTKSDFSVAGGAPFASATNGLAGVLGGAQLGYNWQSGPAVFGLETDFQFSGVNGRIDAPPCPASVCGVATSASYSQKMPWFGTVRGRVGYAQDGWLMYATGGYAYARLDTNAVATAGGASASLSRSETKPGWTLGTGVEVAFSRHWTAKMEYLYVDLGTHNRSWTFAGLPTVNDRMRVYENLVRAGVNYRF
jgi:outer membrane immunogenic protein